LRGANFIDNSESLPVFFECQIDQKFIEQFSGRKIIIAGIKDVDLTKINISQWEIHPASPFINVTIGFSQAETPLERIKGTNIKLHFIQVTITHHDPNRGSFTLTQPFIKSLNDNVQFDNTTFRNCLITQRAFDTLKPHMLADRVKFDRVYIKNGYLTVNTFTDSHGNLMSLRGFSIKLDSLLEFLNEKAEKPAPLEGTYLFGIVNSAFNPAKFKFIDFGGAIFHDALTLANLIDKQILTARCKISKPITILNVDCTSDSLDKLLTHIKPDKLIFKKIRLTSLLVNVLKKHDALNLLQGAIVPYSAAEWLDNPHGAIFDLSFQISSFNPLGLNQLANRQERAAKEHALKVKLFTWLQQNSITINQLINPELTSLFKDLTELDISVLIHHKLLKPAKGQNRIALKDVLIDTFNLNLIISSAELRNKLDLEGCILDVDFTKLSPSKDFTFTKITLLTNVFEALFDAIKVKNFLFEDCLLKLPILNTYYFFNFSRVGQQFELKFNIDESQKFNKETPFSALFLGIKEYLQKLPKIPDITYEARSVSEENARELKPIAYNPEPRNNQPTLLSIVPPINATNTYSVSPTSDSQIPFATYFFESPPLAPPVPPTNLEDTSNSTCETNLKIDSFSTLSEEELLKREKDLENAELEPPLKKLRL